MSTAQPQTTQPDGFSTSPTNTQRGISPIPLLTSSSSVSMSLQSFASVDQLLFNKMEEYTTSLSQYAQLPALLLSIIVKEKNSVPVTNRCQNVLSKFLQNFKSLTRLSHQQKMSAALTHGHRYQIYIMTCTPLICMITFLISCCHYSCICIIILVRILTWPTHSIQFAILILVKYKHRLELCH